ncbi:Endonuclease YncB, thermonuclease family [Haladaptatus paucihalophilus DX253]|uniref:Endonuclease YncB, thermonuclease family n=2 Tax=Haladaptatus paucihalophilus TaxID=367189 RepID=A0A1M7BXC8_HALPU|nr:Endonuclease YncB, thermonuclease family [Haladaptatus paucihalophilus DX253]
MLGLVLLVVLAGCLGSLGLGGSSDDPTTTPSSTEPTQTATNTPSMTTTEATVTTTSPTTTATQTASTTTAATTSPNSTATQATTVPTQTTARIDAPSGSQRFEARVTKIVDPTTIKIERNGKTQTIDLIGVRVPKSGLYHKRALQTTKAQLEYSTVTLVTDPQVGSSSDGHPQMYVYTGEWLYNTQLLRSGYARVADGEFSKRAEFERKQQEAKHGGYGLWKNTSA